MALEITNLRFLDQLRGGAAARRRGVAAQDQGHGDPAGHHRADDADGGSLRPGLPAGRPDPGFDRLTASLVPRYCNVRKATIYAGSNEIQRNIIGKLTLGL